MSSVPANASYAPLAKGALPRPTNVKHTMAAKLKRFALPYMFAIIGSYFGGFVSIDYRPKTYVWLMLVMQS